MSTFGIKSVFTAVMQLSVQGNRIFTKNIGSCGTYKILKMKITTIISILFISFTIAHGQNLIVGTNNNVVWGKESTNDITLQLDFKTKIKPISMTIGYDSPNGIKFRINFKDLNVAANLRYILSMKSGLDEWGDLDDGYYIEAATYDFNEDKNPEIIIVIGNGLTDLWVNVIKYHPPTNPDDAIRTENWSVVASFSGQEKIYIDKQTITVPIGTQGLYDEYTWLNNKFIKSN